ncbi:hypothetical protein [Xanthobacter autotrophicus]|uniref:hypothetical protein n=1 Tax=Xanthobacter autotrophicus TaxID=280 RepID=UPI003728A168
MNRREKLHADERQLIAENIRRHMEANGIARKQLERHDLSLHTINKALIGDFSEATLVKIEAILKTQFSVQQARRDEAPEELGMYTLKAVEDLQGDYVCIRQMFVTPQILTAYCISIRWSMEVGGLTFHESARQDKKYTQKGRVYIPLSKPFMNLVTIDEGTVRNIMLHFPDENNVSRGLIMTVSNPKPSVHIPVAAPICLIGGDHVERSQFGRIKSGDHNYDEYFSMLKSITLDEFCLINNADI